jgi:hypothetical protein
MHTVFYSTNAAGFEEGKKGLNMENVNKRNFF